MGNEREQKLDELIDKCWAHHAWVKGLRCNCNFKHPDPNDPTRTLPTAEFDRILPDNEIPILWFGDINAYEKSPRKIVTVGLNPSDMEFSRTRKDRDEGRSDMFRFEDARSLSGSMMDHLNQDQRERYKKALNHYFLPKEIQTKRKKKLDYTFYGWFGHWSATLEGLDASFEPGTKSYTVVHTDFITPVATTPAWAKLGEKKPCVRDAIILESRKTKLWKQLAETLQPDLILATVAGEKAEWLANDLGTTNKGQPSFPDGDKSRAWTLAETNCFGRRILFVNVPPERGTPFSLWSKSAKNEFGEKLSNLFSREKTQP